MHEIIEEPLDIIRDSSARQGLIGLDESFR